MAPIDKDKIVRQALQYQQRGDYGRAIEELKNILKVHPQDTRTLQKVAELYNKKGDKKGAVKHYCQLAEFYEKNGFADFAISVYRTIIKLDTESMEAHLRLSDLLLKKNLRGEALSFLEQILRVCENKKLDGEMIEVLGKIAEITSDPSVFRRLADLHNYKGRLNLAKDSLHKAISSLKNSSEDRTDEIAELYKKIIEIDSKDRDALAGLAELYIKAGDSARAMEILESITELYPDDLEALQKNAEMLLSSSDTERAKQCLKKLVELYKMKNMFSGVSEAYRKILELDPWDQEALSYVEKENSSQQPLDSGEEGIFVIPEEEVEAVSDDKGVAEERVEEAPPSEEAKDTESGAGAEVESEAGKEEFTQGMALIPEPQGRMEGEETIEENTEMNETHKEETVDFAQNWDLNSVDLDKSSVVTEDKIQIEDPDFHDKALKIDDFDAGALEKKQEKEAELINLFDEGRREFSSTREERNRLSSVKTEPFSKPLEHQTKMDEPQAEDKDDESEAHYSLGVAYKNMNLLDNAILEFRKSMGGMKSVEAHAMIGICYIYKREPEKALKWFQKGLALQGISAEQTLVLKCGLAITFGLINNLSEAVGILEEFIERLGRSKRGGDKSAFQK